MAGQRGGVRPWLRGQVCRGQPMGGRGRRAGRTTAPPVPSTACPAQSLSGQQNRSGARRGTRPADSALARRRDAARPARLRRGPDLLSIVAAGLTANGNVWLRLGRWRPRTANEATPLQRRKKIAGRAAGGRGGAAARAAPPPPGPHRRDSRMFIHCQPAQTTCLHHKDTEVRPGCPPQSRRYLTTIVFTTDKDDVCFMVLSQSNRALQQLDWRLTCLSSIYYCLPSHNQLID